MNSEDFDYLFPFDQARQNQKEKVIEIVNAFENSRFVLVQAPTGSGKSVIAYTIANWFKQKGLTSYVLTSQKLLQEQYVDDFKSIKLNSGCKPLTAETVKSASSYICKLNSKRTCNVGACKYDSNIKCPCEYKEKREATYQSDFAILNYAYFLKMGEYTTKLTENNSPIDLIKQSPRYFLICDECHNLETLLTSLCSVSINFGDFSALGIKSPKAYSGNSDQDAIYWLSDVSIHCKKMKTLSEKTISTSQDDTKTVINESKKVDFLTNIMDQIDRVEYIVDKKLPIIINSTNKLNMTYKPLSVSDLSEDLLFKFGIKVLLMSATILNKDQYCKTLGINQSDCTYIQLPCTFPVENRPIYDLGDRIGPINYNNLQEVKPKIAKVIEILLKKHGNERGIIHTPSYELTDYIMETVNSPRLFCPKGSNREKAINDFLEDDTKSDGVLISPSLTEGLDLDGDLGKFCIIVKAPYASLADPYIKAKMQADPAWYQLECIRKIIQSCGRVTRSETDTSVSYLLDANITNLFRKEIKSIPSWFYNSIKKA